ncbi:cell division protein FtsQ/DivIB [Ottowia sp.]|uniref:cell division protein FtsQ/DivIB n=1 Tax=Ottowia sp. TaxID=1898956 RepID=UPI003A842EC9
MTQHLPIPVDVKLMNLTASLLVTLLVLACLAVGVRWVVRHPVFAIEQITVGGDTTHNNAASLRSSVLSKLVGNFFTMDLSAAQAAFQSAPWVRSAMVQREFPNALHVTLQEHVPVARWGEDNAHMVDRAGKVFEAAVGDADEDDLPTLIGPEGRSAEVWSTYQQLRPLVQPIGADMVELALLARGNWRARLDAGAVIELGQGSSEQLASRLNQFAGTVKDVANRHQRPIAAIESADLRHPGGYALRLRGISTVGAAEQVVTMPTARANTAASSNAAVRAATTSRTPAVRAAARR